MAIGSFDTHIPGGNESLPHHMVEVALDQAPNTVARVVLDETTVQMATNSVTIEVIPLECFPDASRSEVFLATQALGSLSRSHRESAADRRKRAIIQRVQRERALLRIGHAVAEAPEEVQE